MEPSNVFVCLMGLGTVFVGLTCIIILCQVMSFLCMRSEAHKPVISSETPAPKSTSPIPNRGEFVAAVSSAIAEDLGEDVSAIRIISITKLQLRKVSAI